MLEVKLRLPLVLAAGLLCDAAVWQPVADRLRDVADVTIVAFAGCDSLGAMADRLLAAAPPRFALAGHSMGARVALEAHDRAPDRVRRLALINTGIHLPGPAEPASRRRLVELAREEGMDAVVREWLPPMVGARASQDDALMGEMAAMVRRMTPHEFGLQQEAMLARPDAAAALTRVTVPVLLASSPEDGWSPPAQHEAMREQAPHATVEIIPDAGHMSPMEAPDAVAALLRRWLTS